MRWAMEHNDLTSLAATDAHDDDDLDLFTVT
jgi:hypothetical protein